MERDCDDWAFGHVGPRLIHLEATSASALCTTCCKSMGLGIILRL